ncbi:MAG: hypothetical protein ABIP02_07120 [Arenimonas sp.]
MGVAMRSIYWVGLSCLLLLSLSACKPEENRAAAEKKPEPVVATTEATKEKSDGPFGGIFSDEPKPAKLDLGEFKILEVNLGTSLDADNLVSHPKTQFTSKEKIYASVLCSGKHQGLKIKAVWTAPDGVVVAQTEQALVPTGGTVNTFSISNSQAWPTGAYTLDIALNDVVQRTVSFEVK